MSSTKSITTLLPAQGIDTSDVQLPTQQDRHSQLLAQGVDSDVAELIAPLHVSHEMAFKIGRTLGDIRGRQNYFLSLVENDHPHLGIFEYLKTAQRPSVLEIPQEGSPHYSACIELSPFGYETMAYIMNTLLGFHLFESFFHKSDGGLIDISTLMRQKISMSNFDIIWDCAVQAIPKEQAPGQPEQAKQNMIDAYFSSESSILIRSTESGDFSFGSIESAIFYVLKYISAISTSFISNQGDFKQNQPAKRQIIQMLNRLEQSAPDSYSLEGQILKYLRLLTNDGDSLRHFDNIINQTPFPILNNVNRIVSDAQKMLSTKIQGNPMQKDLSIALP